ncbi:MFS transporter [Azorhizobium oxalatiphilum]|uniref:MFS transporter n=1 Tax=Azorhizobium oxalatiphilum TaxID=980631 RepID=A0A917FKB7_9HYPH|nr:MFS transporter [Azorhizobium oxalatiphilum]GGF86225.1 MFS transporter [Azorhizobium oxalatiphilum]
MTPAHWLLIASLYVTQFLPVSFFFMGLPAILRSEGRSLEELSVLYLLGLVWVVKVLWAPLVDRISFGRLGHYRGWLIFMQSAMIIMLLLISRIDGVSDMGLLMALSLVLTMCAGTQDIATDAIAVRLIPPGMRGVGNSLQVGGGLVGIALGGGATLALYNLVGWAGCLWLMAAVVATTLVQIVLFREPAATEAEEEAKGGAGQSYARLWRFWRRPGIGRWALVMMLTPVGIGMVFGLLTPMLVDIGWSLERVGFTLNVTGSLVGLPAVLITGVLIRRWSRRAMLVGAALVQAAAILALLPLAGGERESQLVLPALLLVFLIYNPIATIMMTIMMDHADPRTAGTDFTAQCSFYTLMGFASGALALSIAQAHGYRVLVLVAAGCALLAGALALWLFRDPAREKPAVEKAAPTPAE